MKFDKQLLKQAIQNVLAQKMLLGVELGSKWYAAIQKAETELEFNKTIEFDGIVLTFVSRDSNERRFVTKSGCTEFCKCGGGISYHKAIFAIVAQYKLIAPEDLNLQPTEKICKSCTTRVATTTGRCNRCERNSQPTYLPNSDRGKAVRVGGIRIN